MWNSNLNLETPVTFLIVNNLNNLVYRGIELPSLARTEISQIIEVHDKSVARNNDLIQVLHRQTVSSNLQWFNFPYFAYGSTYCILLPDGVTKPHSWREGYSARWRVPRSAINRPYPLSHGTSSPVVPSSGSRPRSPGSPMITSGNDRFTYSHSVPIRPRCSLPSVRCSVNYTDTQHFGVKSALWFYRETVLPTPRLK